MPIKLMEAYLKELAQVPIEGIIQKPWVGSLRFQWHCCLLSKTKIKTKFTPWVANRSMSNDRKLSHLVNKYVGQSNPQGSVAPVTFDTIGQWYHIENYKVAQEIIC